jgi:hypothetical protein
MRGGKEEISGCLPPPGRHAYLDVRAIRTLVRKLLPGLNVSAHVERRRDAWRLRVSFTGDNGARVRRGITLPDEETARWVKANIAEAKEKRRTGRTT